MQKNSPTQTAFAARLRPQSRGLAEEIAIIYAGFTAYLRERGFADFTIEQYQRRLVRVARWLCDHRWRGRLSKLTRQRMPHLLKDFLPNRHPETAICYRKALHHWLRFQGQFARPTRPARWQPWLCDYIEFLHTHRGVGPSVIEHAEASVRSFLRWQFGRGEADWRAVKISDIWRFAEEHVRGVKPIYGKARLGRLRRFLNFVHLRGACSTELAAAVPRIAVFGHAPCTVILSETQCKTLLGSFSRALPEGRRDYAMTLCMLELGLRGAEVIGLRLHDIDWRRRRLNVPATKTGRGRELPIPKRVFIALRDYVKRARPATSTDHVFVRHPRLAGQPLSRSVLKQMIRRAYRRCGFPHSWSGERDLDNRWSLYRYN